jgi:hypothetical protein
VAWTVPRTWNPGETVTASLMNAHVRDNMNALSGRAIVITIGAVGAGVIATGVKMYIEVPVTLKIIGWTLVANVSGSIVIDVWRDSYANFPPTVADTIAGSEKPTLSSVQKNQDLTLTTWTQTVNAGDVLGINVDSATTVEQVTLTLRCEPL